MRRSLWMGWLMLALGCGAEARPDAAREAAKLASAQADWWVPDGLVLRPPLQPDASEPRFCLVTHHDAKGSAFAQLAIDSHRRYAARHGYGQRTFVGHISGDAFVDPARGGLDDLFGGGLYWQKIAAMQQVLTHGAPDVVDVTNDAGAGAGAGAAQGGQTAHEMQATPCDWVLWLDSDAVFTNEGVSLADVVYTYATDQAGELPADVLVARDAKYPINSGVMLVRNTAAGRAFVDEVAATYPTFRNRGLPDQDAVIAVVHHAQTYRAHDPVGALLPSVRVVVAPQRAFNSFGGPGAQLAPDVQWQPCDFVAHFAGVPHAERPARMRLATQMAAQCTRPRAMGVWQGSLGMATAYGPVQVAPGAGGARSRDAATR